MIIFYGFMLFRKLTLHDIYLEHPSIYPQGYILGIYPILYMIQEYMYLPNYLS